MPSAEGARRDGTAGGVEPGARWNGCGVCSRLQDDEFRLMTRLQNDLARDAAAADAVAAEGGICNYHMWYLRRLASPAVVVGLAGAIVRAAVGRVSPNTGHPADTGSAAGRRGGQCRICRALHESEIAHLRSWIAGPGTNERTGDGSPDLCLPHFVVVASRCDPSIRRRVSNCLADIAEHCVRVAIGGTASISAGTAAALSSGLPAATEAATEVDL